jgi:hypothetical protein
MAFSCFRTIVGTRSDVSAGVAHAPKGGRPRGTMRLLTA